MKVCIRWGLLEVHWPTGIFGIWFCFSALEGQSQKLLFKNHKLLLFILLLCTCLLWLLPYITMSARAAWVGSAGPAVSKFCFVLPCFAHCTGSRPLLREQGPLPSWHFFSADILWNMHCCHKWWHMVVQSCRESPAKCCSLLVPQGVAVVSFRLLLGNVIMSIH